MTDTRKEFERAVSNLGWAFDYIGDGQYGSHTIQFANKLWQACQSLNDKRMEQLLAVIKNQREALKLAHEFIRNGIDLGYIRMPDEDTPDPAHKTPSIVEQALSLQPSDVELSDIGYISEYGEEVFLSMGLQLDAETCGVPVTKLYTIKTKATDTYA